MVSDGRTKAAEADRQPKAAGSGQKQDGGRNKKIAGLLYPAINIIINGLYILFVFVLVIVIGNNYNKHTGFRTAITRFEICFGARISQN